MVKADLLFPIGLQQTHFNWTWTSLVFSVHDMSQKCASAFLHQKKACRQSQATSSAQRLNPSLSHGLTMVFGLKFIDDFRASENDIRERDTVSFEGLPQKPRLRDKSRSQTWCSTTSSTTRRMNQIKVT